MISPRNGDGPLLIVGPVFSLFPSLLLNPKKEKEKSPIFAIFETAVRETYSRSGEGSEKFPLPPSFPSTLFPKLQVLVGRNSKFLRVGDWRFSTHSSPFSLLPSFGEPLTVNFHSSETFAERDWQVWNRPREEGGSSTREKPLLLFAENHACKTFSVGTAEGESEVRVDLCQKFQSPFRAFSSGRRKSNACLFCRDSYRPGS